MQNSQTRLVRYEGLVERGVVKNRTTLYRWIKNFGFPPGKLIGPNTRAWPEDEIDAWLASRPEKAPAAAQPIAA